MAQPLCLVRLGNAADVLLEGIEAKIVAGGHEGGFSDVKGRIELAGKLPGELVEDVDHTAHGAADADGRAHAQVRNIDDPGLGDNIGSVERVAANDDRIGVEGLRELD